MRAQSQSPRQSGWLSDAEDLIRQHYGIEASGNAIKIEFTTFTDGVGGTLARVAAQVGASGPGTNIALQIDMADFVPSNPPNGGNAPFYNDRVLTHEMTHAVMDATMNVGSIFTNNQQFFLEGAAELIHGADERLNADITNNGGGATGIAAVMAKVSDWGLERPLHWPRGLQVGLHGQRHRIHSGSGELRQPDG